MTGENKTQHLSTREVFEPIFGDQYNELANEILVDLVVEYPIAINGLLGHVFILQDHKTGEKYKRIEMEDGSVSVTQL